MNNPTLRSTLITFASFIFVITAVNAWTGPSVPAPDGNVSAPLTISATSQSKTGGLDVGWLSAVGAVKVGYTATACTADLAGSLRWNTGVMEYCNGTVWGPFVGSGTGGGGENSCLTGTGLLKAYAGKSASYTASGSAVGSASVTVTISVNPDGTAVTCSRGGGGSATLTAANLASNVNSAGGGAYGPSITYGASAGFVCVGSANGVGSQMVSSRVTLPAYNDNLIAGNYLYDGSYTWNDSLGEGVYDSGSASLASGVDALSGGGVKDKCLSSGSSVAETDPTVLTSVKDGVDWSEVTGKPTALRGVIAGCDRSGACWGGAWGEQDISMHCPSGSTGHSMHQTTDVYGPGYHSYFCVQD